MSVTYEVSNGKAVWGGKHLRAWVPALVQALVRDFDPVRIVLLGSVAQGTDGPDSDVDLLVVLDDMARSDHYDILVEMHRSTRDLAPPTDFIVTSVDKFDARRERSGTIEHEAARHGRVVYDRRAA